MSVEEQNGMSIIVPFLNEEEGIELFCKKIDEYAGTAKFRLELVFVDDGSTDGSVEKLKRYSFKNIFSAKIVGLSRNYGSHAAIRAGLTKAGFDICTWMGSDLQEPFELLDQSYKMIMEEGYDAVYVEKKSIEVSFFNRLFSRIYSGLMRRFAVSSYSSGGISTIVFGKNIKDHLNDNIELNSSIMLQIMNAGFKYRTISLEYGKRAVGRSKWTLSKKIKLFIDSFVAFSFMPVRLISVMGMLIFLIGLIFGIISIVLRCTDPGRAVGLYVLICVAGLGFGLTNISLGIIAEYLWRTYDSARGRSVFIISHIYDLMGEADEK